MCDSGAKAVSPLIVILITQFLFSLTDLLARAHLKHLAFTPASFMQPWFIWYILTRAIFTFAQFYVFTKIDLGKTSTLFAITAIIMSNILGVLFLKEVLSVKDYLGVALALASLVILSIK
jgi:drug/metabolite transporter (DMT)-like permease